MRAFNPTIAAAVAAFLGATYLVLGLVMGHSARSEVPPDLSAKGAEEGLDVWKAAAALLEGGGKSLVVDVRVPEDYAQYHIPRSINVPDADPARLVDLARAHAPLIIVAGGDQRARELVRAARTTAVGARIHYLVDGPRAWFLAFELPVPLFSEAPPPFGYGRALATVRDCLARPDPALTGSALDALRTLARINLQPTLLRQAGKPKATGGAKKKISGGCG